MRLPRGWRRLFRHPFRDRHEDESIRTEIDHHLEELERQLHRTGSTPEEARRAARSSFGDPELWHARALRASRQRTRRQVRRDRLVGIEADLRMALRQIVRKPALTGLLLAVTTMGVAGGTVVWAVVDAQLLRPLPIEDPDELVVVMGSDRRSESWWVSRFAYEAWDRGQRSFSAMAVVRDASMTLLEPFPHEVGVLRAESRFFDLVGVRPALGRAFTPADDLAGAPDLLILTDRIWRGRFDADPDVIGREVRIRGGVATVVGVMPPSFSWEAIQWDNPAREGAERLVLRNRIFGSDRGALASSGALLPLARLRRGVTLEQARADLARVGRTLAEAYPGEYIGDDGAWVPNVRWLRWIWTRFSATDVSLLGGAALLMLLLVAVNGTSLLTIRVLDRRTELTVRASLGAGRFRLARQVLVETGVVWGAALLFGIVLAGVALPWIRGLIPPAVSFTDDLQLTRRVAAGAVSCAVSLWLLTAVLPVRDVGRSARASLSSAGSGGVGRRRGRVQRALIVGQIALACTLLTGAGVLLRGYASLRAVDIGLDSESVAVLYLELPSEYREPAGTVADAGGVEAWAEEWFTDDSPVFRPGPRFQSFVANTLARMERVPGVTSVTFTNQAPLWESAHWRGTRMAPGGEEPDEDDPWVRLKWVSPGYFETLGMKPTRGRTFVDADQASAEPVAILNEALAEHLFGRESAVGRAVSTSISAYFPPERRTVVGVVRTVLHYGPHEPSEPVLYVPVAQIPQAWAADQIGFAMRATFLARHRGEQGAVVQGLREAVWAAEPDLPITRASTLEEQYELSMAEPRFFLVLLGAFATLALTLSAVGILATLGQHVRQRTAELGIRKALGADTADLLRRSLGEGLRLGSFGVALGSLLAWILTRGLAAQIVGLSGLDPRVLLVVGLVLVVTSVCAAMPPGLRAGRVDPMEALRVG